jgi:redox-sensitive bicupin YhaK (pirin superfamily)
MAGIQLRRAADRYRTTEGGVDAWHCLSYGSHYDPHNTSFGVLVACNEFTLAPGSGFADHGHAGLEIVSWVLAGRLRHEDSTGRREVLRPGFVQRLTAGTGVRHAETNPFRQPLRFVQLWIVPDEPGRPPEYARADLRAALSAGDLVAVASGRPECDAPLRLGQPAATLHAATPPAGRTLALPDAPYLQLYVADGAVALVGGEQLCAGDEVRLTGATGVRVATADHPAQILVWEMHDRI